MKAVNLKCGYLRDPVGTDNTKPELSWNCSGGITQTAYRILASDENGAVIWDTGRVESPSMTHIRWCGRKLASRYIVLWKVKLWDENGNEGDWSEEASFELGLLSANDWKARWITGDYDADSSLYRKKRLFRGSMLLNGIDFLANMNRPDNTVRYPVDCFRHCFGIKKEVKKARLYITACGLYEAQINGKRAGDFVLAPGITDYRKRIQYQTYDVADLLRRGDNEITVLLADGWYRGSVGAWGLKQEYGYETKVLAQLEITCADGSSYIEFTNRKWQWSNDGPLRFADNKDGEIVEASMIPSYNAYAKETEFGVVPTASENVKISERERYVPVKIITPSGKTVLDFGKNIAGYIEFETHAKKGDRIFLRFGEMLGSDGEFTQKNFQVSSKRITSPLQQIKYICGDGTNRYKTRFAIFGFRYVLVDSDIEIRPADFTAIAVYSDIERTGFFNSSNELLNRFVEATVLSAKNNSADIPTDCPTRERHGWTGDAQIFFQTASYLFDYSAFSKKYLRDVFDWQTKDGKLPQIAPEGGTDFFMKSMNGSVGWADAGIIIPYFFWKKYGDRAILEEYYPQMARYARFMERRIGRNSILSVPHNVAGKNRKYIVNCGQSYGEWAEPKDVFPNRWTDMILPHTEVSTAYTSYVLRLMSEIACELRKDEDSRHFREVSDNCRKAYRELVSTEKYSLDTDRQSCLVRPLAFDLLDEKQTEYARKRLLQALENYDYKVGTGFLSTPLILGVLDKYDIAAAYRLLENEQMPGWLYMMKAGATTVWESWEGTGAQGGIASLDHYSKGAVCEWLFSSMCGIKVAGENRFAISPRPGGHFRFASVEYRSVYGIVKSGWKTENGKTVYEIEIPANTSANISLPGGYQENVAAGKYTFEINGEIK